MKSTVIIASLFALAAVVSAGSGLEHFPLRHRHGRRAAHKHHHKKHAELPAVKRSSQCPFPHNAGLVAITPSEQNAGWAMSPNQPCVPGSWCPIACPSGMKSRLLWLMYRASDEPVESRCHFLHLSYQYGTHVSVTWLMAGWWTILSRGRHDNGSISGSSILCGGSRKHSSS